METKKGVSAGVPATGSGRNPEELSRKFEPTAQAIRNWQTEMKAGVPVA